MTVSRSLDALLVHIVDYAGLFPPAQLGMAEAVSEYAAYLTGSEQSYLGRFVVPVARLGEFDVEASGLLPKGEGSTPWRLSALAGSDLRSDIARMLTFNCEHWSGSERGHAVIDAVELKAATVAEIDAAAALIPRSVSAAVEVPITSDPAPLVSALAGAGMAAKVRTGGTTEAAFPASRDIVRFIAACQHAGVPFKATAGLHHPIRGPYPLTYDRDAVQGTMFGFLNVFLCAAFLRNGLSGEDAVALLEERAIDAFRFDDTGVQWRGHTLSVEQLVHTRRHFALSFGSCSFREPIEDLRTHHLL